MSYLLSSVHSWLPFALRREIVYGTKFETCSVSVSQWCQLFSTVVYRLVEQHFHYGHCSEGILTFRNKVEPDIL